MSCLLFIIRFQYCTFVKKTKMKKYAFLIVAASMILLGCNTKTSNKTAVTDKDSVQTESAIDTANAKKNTASEILAKKQIPILCYHRIADGRTDDYSVSEATFESHMKILQDSGYHSVLPDQLYDYLVYNKTLPEKPFMITFDDSRIEHIEKAAPIMEKHGFRGAFFIMTITYNKKNYMTTDQIAELAKRGHTVGLHSWDHTMSSKYKDSVDWKKQVIEPKAKLEGFIGQPVKYWAYPYGVYNHEAAKGMDKYFKISFILSNKRDSVYPLQTVRRMIIPTIKPERLLKSMQESFK